MPVRKQLGQILLEAGVLDEYQLKSALGYQKRWGGRLGRVLVDNHFITEKALVEAIHKQTGVEVVDVSTLQVPDYLVRLVPPELASRHMLVPVRLEGGAGKSSETLFVAMADPTNLEALDELRFRTGKRTRPLLAAESEIEKAIKRIYLKQPEGQPAEVELPRQEEGEIIQGHLEQPPPIESPQIVGENQLDLKDPFAALEPDKPASPAQVELPEIEVVDDLEAAEPLPAASSPAPPSAPPTASAAAPVHAAEASRPVSPPPIKIPTRPAGPPPRPVTEKPEASSRPAEKKAALDAPPGANALASAPVVASETEGRQIDQVVSELESRLGSILERLTSAESEEKLPALMKPSHIVAALIRLLLQKKIFTIEELLKELEKQ